MESWDEDQVMGVGFSHPLSKGEASRMESEKATDLVSTALLGPSWEQKRKYHPCQSKGAEGGEKWVVGQNCSLFQSSGCPEAAG